MERNNEQKLELLADLIEPMSKILSDKDITDPIAKSSKPWTEIISLALKKHSAEIIEIMANIEGVPVEEYQINILALPIKLMAFVNKPEVQELFTGQGQKIGNESSGSATENTEDGAK